MSATKRNLTLDIVIFFAFLVMSNPSITGFAIHEWLGVSAIAALITHILFHWAWIVSITRTFFNKLIHSSRLNYVVNLGLFVAMTAVMLSGLMISKNVLATFGIVLNASRAWRSIHSLSANFSLVMVGLHFALHWKWITTHVQRYIITPVSALIRRPITTPVSPKLAIQPLKIEQNR